MGLLDKLLGRGKAAADKGMDVVGDVANKTGLDDAADKVKDVASGAVNKGKDLLGGGEDKP
ncbi:MAG: hypothetical protein OXG37_08590 [Actinomycetia bacterium]|nr:hypothetical protein [Actinomycetes bacterium]